MTKRQLLINRWKSPIGEILQSNHRYDFVMDSAGNFIDGGIDGYIRIGGRPLEEWENLCLYADAPHEKIREMSLSGSPTESTSRSLKGFILY